MAKQLIKKVGPYQNLYRDTANGLAWVEDGSTGLGHSCHPNIDASGSVSGMKKRGYWNKNDRTVNSHGFIYNIDEYVVSDALDRLAGQNCRCGGYHGGARSNPAGIRAQVRRLPSGQVQIKIPLKGGRRGNPVYLEDVEGKPLSKRLVKLQRYGDHMLKDGTQSVTNVAKRLRGVLGRIMDNATITVDDGKGNRAYNPHGRMCNPGVRQTSCRHCGLDIEGIAPYKRGEWRDRGNNTHCPDGKLHAPYIEHRRGQKNPPRGTVDTHAARELELYIDNDGDLYRRQYQPILKNLATKKARGVYQHHLAVKLFMYLMESGAKKYAKEFSVGTDWSTIFNVPTRMEVAERFAKHFENEYATAAYNHLLPKKYQPKT
jgi:hypothetical protein